MISSLARVNANRLNALKSTGPLTSEGKAKASRNALKAGLFATLMVVPAAGETAEEFDVFRRRVRGDLLPSGPVEKELADRVAGLLWRLRRVVRHEAAALASVPVKLPPHPDEVTTEDIHCDTPRPPATAPTAVRLAYARYWLEPGRSGGDEYRVAAGEVRGLDKGPASRTLDAGVAYRVPGAVIGLVERMQQPGGWFEFLDRHQIPRPEPCVAWTAGWLRRVLGAAAREARQPPTEFRSAVAERLEQSASEADTRRERLVGEERELVRQLLEERARAGAAATLADEALLARVARAESHLTRELERALALLDRLRASGGGVTRWLGGRDVLGGFVLPGGGLPAPANGSGPLPLGLRGGGNGCATAGGS